MITRKLTPREWMLLAVLIVLALVSGYIAFFRNPMIRQRDAMIQEAELCRIQLEAARVRLEEKHRMERELEEIFAKNSNPLSLAPYDNLQAVMVELHRILASAEDYTLTFSTVDPEPVIVRRSINITFTTSGYSSAKAILQQLHDSRYRCLLENFTITVGRDFSAGSTSVTGTIVFFEYHPRENRPPAPAAQ